MFNDPKFAEKVDSGFQDALPGRIRTNLQFWEEKHGKLPVCAPVGGFFAENAKFL